MIAANKLMMPFRREVWEYQRSFYGVFIATGAVLLLLAIFGLFQLSNHVDVNIQVDNETMTFSLGDEITNEKSEAIDDALSSFVGKFLVAFVLLSGFVSAYYLLGALYEDRKDRSILFWKSLPVSETQTVLTKFAVGLFVIPAIAIAIGYVTLVLLTVVISVWLPMVSDLSFVYAWVRLDWFSGIWDAFKFTLLSGLWLAPFAAWLLFASAVSRRSPLLWALAPPLLITMSETLLFGYSRFGAMIGAYLTHFSIDSDLADSDGVSIALNDVFAPEPELFLGLMLAAALLYASIWLRNNRYEI